MSYVDIMPNQYHPHVPTEISPEHSAMDGLKNSPIFTYTNLRDLQKHITALSNGHTEQQYLVFRDVTEGQFAEIEHKRHCIIDSHITRISIC
jgi:hypothetical protein